MQNQWLAHIFIRCIRAGIALVMTFVLTACFPTHFVRDSVLEDSPCDVPCWQGIKIGDKLTTEDVKRMLNSLPNVNSVWQPIPADVAWHWRWAKNTGPNSIYLDLGVVTSISLYFDSDVTVAEIIAKYGEPTAVRISDALLPEEPFALLTMIYPTRGTRFIVEVSPRNAPDLTPATTVTEVRYWAPESMEDWRAAEYQKDLQPWPGYGQLSPPTP